MSRPGKIGALPVVTSIALAVATLIFDLYLPLGVAGGVPYVALVLIGLWVPGRRFVLSLAAIATALTFLGYFYSPPGGIPWVVLTNRALAVFAIWITALLIAHRKQAEEALRESEARANGAEQQVLDAIESISEGFVLFDANGRLVLCNKKYKELYGYSDADTAPGVHTRDLGMLDIERGIVVLESDDPEAYLSRRDNLKGDPLRSYMIRFADGRHLRTRDRRTAAGGIVSVQTDITERKRAEERLQMSEDRLRRSVLDAPIPIMMHAEGGEVLMISKRWTELSGYSPADIPNILDWTEKAYGADSERVRDRIGRLYEIEEPIEDEAYVTTASGERRAWDFRTAPLGRLPDGRRFVISMAVDITERKAAEEATKEWGAQVTRLAGNLRQLIDGANAPIIAVNKRYQITEWNEAAARITGHSKDHVLYCNLLNEFVPEAFRETVGAIFDRAVQGETTSSFEFPILAKGGTEAQLLFGANPQRDANGEIIGVIGVGQDITTLKRAEDALRQAQKMEAVGQLTGGVAHDFNNLMAIMINNAELLKDAVGEDEEAKACIEEIEAAIDRGSSLTGRLLAFSRKQALSPVAADLSGLIDGLHDMLRRTLGETVDLKVEGTPDLWPAQIDPHQFDNALVNLAINARDAMAQGGTLVIETANVTLDKTYAQQQEEVTPGDYVMVAVSDSGTGMAPEVLEKVFDPFFTTKEVGKGSGLGLSMVYGFMKQSKGHITIYSEVGHGTTVKLYMPRSPEGAAKTAAGDDALESAGGSERILIVEDDPVVRKGAVRILRGHGYEVVEAGNGAEAIDHLKTGRSFDLLFTDLVLPGGMNGVEIAEAAKRRQPNIEVLYTTGYAENAVVHNGKLDPGVTLVNKPYRRTELLEKVRAVLDGKDD